MCKISRTAGREERKCDREKEMETNDKFIHRKFKTGRLRKGRTTKVRNISKVLESYYKITESDGSSTRIEYAFMIHAHFLS